MSEKEERAELVRMCGEYKMKRVEMIKLKAQITIKAQKLGVFKTIAHQMDWRRGKL